MEPATESDPSLPFRTTIEALKSTLVREEWQLPLGATVEVIGDLPSGLRGGEGVIEVARTPEQDYPELRAQLAEARSDAKLAEALGRMDAGFADIKGNISALNTRLDAIERSTSGLKATVIGTAVATVAVVIGVLAYGQTWFGIGVSTRDVVRATVAEMTQARPAVSPPRP